MGILKVFFNNTRKPEGLLGRCMVGSMNLPSRIGALAICLKQVPPRLRSWAAVVGGISEPFCENTLPRLSPPWTIQKYLWKRPGV